MSNFHDNNTNYSNYNGYPNKVPQMSHQKKPALQLWMVTLMRCKNFF